MIMERICICIDRRFEGFLCDYLKENSKPITVSGSPVKKFRHGIFRRIGKPSVSVSQGISWLLLYLSCKYAVLFSNCLTGTPQLLCPLLQSHSRPTFVMSSRYVSLLFTTTWSICKDLRTPGSRSSLSEIFVTIMLRMRDQLKVFINRIFKYKTILNLSICTFFHVVLVRLCNSPYPFVSFYCVVNWVSLTGFMVLNFSYNM